VKDMIGNKIQEGSLVLWKEKGLIFRVVKASDGGLSVVGASGKGTTPPIIVLQITLPVSVENPRLEPVLTDFLCALDPQQQAAVEIMIKQ